LPPTLTKTSSTFQLSYLEIYKVVVHVLDMRNAGGGILNILLLFKSFLERSTLRQIGASGKK